MKIRKLHSLKNWYSLEDAAKRLSITLDEEVNFSDVLQLAIEEHLPLSLSARHTYAVPVRHYTHILNWDKDFITRQQRLSKHIKTQNTLTCDPSKITHTRERFETPEHIKNVFLMSEPMHLDLELCGALKDWFVSHQGGSASEVISLDGYFLRDAERGLWRVMESFPTSMQSKEERSDLSKSIYDIDNYYPSGSFPDIADVGFQRQDLEDFENSLNNITKPNESASTKEKESLLTMVIAMATDCYGHNPQQNKNPTTNDIKRAVEKTGLSLNEDTIRKWLKESENLLPQEYLDTL